MSRSGRLFIVATLVSISALVWVGCGLFDEDDEEILGEEEDICSLVTTSGMPPIDIGGCEQVSGYEKRDMTYDFLGRMTSYTLEWKCADEGGSVTGNLTITIGNIRYYSSGRVKSYDYKLEHGNKTYSGYVDVEAGVIAINGKECSIE